jgi:hypothetical protein
MYRRYLEELELMNVTIIQVGKDLKGKVADRSLSVEVS